MKLQDLTTILAASLQPIIANAVNEALPKALAGIKIDTPVKGEDYGGVELAAEVLGWARQTVYMKIKEIPHYKRGKRLYFKRSDLLEYIRSGNK